MGAIDASFSVSFFREPLFNNATFEVARIGDPAFAGKLRERYEHFAEGLPSQIEREISFHSTGTKVTAMALAGPAASFRAYDEIDVNLLVAGRCMPMFHANLKIADEKHSSVTKRVALYLRRDDRLTPEMYTRWFFAKPIMSGRLPDFYSSEVARHSLRRTREALAEYLEQMPGRKKLATHSLIDACSNIYTYCRLKDRPLPEDFVKIVQLLHTIDYQGRFDEPTLTAIRYIIENWDLQEQHPVR